MAQNQGWRQEIVTALLNNLSWVPMHNNLILESVDLTCGRCNTDSVSDLPASEDMGLHEQQGYYQVEAAPQQDIAKAQQQLQQGMQ